ncbi:RNA polymerase sigma factor [Pedobacter africanus]|uniref:RNA polymerase sigma-70 factor, ECF subfamily n=1 Tax=Pedobacter africanus TaxID=151894 RepID=A0A1W1ZKD2_9SPHI|nr:sigma-70 family RNA polymerase sigma factor [Pedobacter africanus]SMC48844.1 RNA polymerase sigma-70 factor, ECF subfamily [Pedobacter africanus]
MKQSGAQESWTNFPIFESGINGMTVYTELNDNELASLLKAGGEAVYKEIYNRYWDKLYYIAHRMLKQQEAAEEVVQDVFVLLWKKRAELAIQSLAVYLAAMTRYEVYRYLAKDKRDKNNAVDYQSQLGDQVSFDADLEHKLLLEIIAELSNQLPKKCRLVFQYVKLQDRPLAEVAQEMNISQKTAEAHLTKALKTIRGNMGNAMHLLF